jgi:hypothetical protein
VVVYITNSDGEDKANTKMRGLFSKVSY